MVESVGVHTIGLIVGRDLGWIFRPQPQDDYGIDGHIEIVDDDSYVTGRMIGVQIKSGDSYLRGVRRSETEAGWSYWGDSDHLAYWLGHCLPVIIAFVDDNGDAYWQVVDGDSVVETPAGFTAWVPAANTFDASTKSALRTYARQWRDITAKLPELLEGIPLDCHRGLRRAEETDAVATGRLAQLLHEGWPNPSLTVSTLLASSPTWLANSPTAEMLWMVLGAFALAHDSDEVASDAFLRAAVLCGEQRARALAFAGLALSNFDRERAAPLLHQASAEGAELLAHVGIAALNVPLDDARVLDIPDCMLGATAEELDAEPTVLNFLAEMALRQGDLDSAVGFRERAAGDGRRGGAMDLALAETLVRRGRISTGTASDSRRAVTLLSGVIETRRRWHGPSSEALRALVELHLAAGSIDDALRSALPVSLGGFAQDNELTPPIARAGATAALALQRLEDLKFFEEQLAGTIEGREVQALRGAFEGRPNEALVQAWETLIHDASDDQMRARAVDRLARLGRWSPVADDMRARSVLPPQQADILRATFEACEPDGDVELGLMRLRDLSRKTPMAAVQLIGLLEDRGDLGTAIAECTELSALWPNETVLGGYLIALHWSNGQPGEALALTRMYAADERMPAPTRLAMCRSSAARLYREGRYAEAAEMDRVGLAAGDDPELIWNLIASLHAIGRITDARRELRARNATPATSAEVRLWLELQLGVDLTTTEAGTLVELAGAELDPKVRGVMYTLLEREVVEAGTRQGSKLDRRVVEEARVLLESADLANDRLAAGPIEETSGETADRLRNQLAAQSLTPEQVTSWLGQYSRGLIAVHQIADQLGQAYGFALIQRPGAIYTISDLTPGLRKVGREAARAALVGRSCVADLSALFSLTLLPRPQQERLRARTGELWVPASLARDAAATREQVRDACSRPQLLALHSDGRSTWVRQTLTERAHAKDLSDRLIELVDLIRTQVVPGSGVVKQLAALAAVRVAPVWCDDNATRQALRGCGVTTFSTVELLDELTPDVPEGDPDVVLMALARARSVDLPLSGSQLVALIWDETNAGADVTSSSAAAVALTRASWWSDRCRDASDPAGKGSGEGWARTWRTDWPLVAVEAARAGPAAYLSVFGAALTGISDAYTGAIRSRNQLELFVLTLSSCWRAEVLPPASLLDGLVDAGLPADPDVISYALINRLRDLGAADPTAAAWSLLHP